MPPPPIRPFSARPLPDAQEARRILLSKRSRPAIRPPPPAGAALARTLKAFDARFGGSGAGVGPLSKRWREVVGDLLARRTEPVRLIRARAAAVGRSPSRSAGPASAASAGGTLEVRVDGPAASLVQHQAPEILARANLVLGEGAVTRLRIVQGPVRATRAVQAPAAPRRRLASPLDADVEAELARGLAGAPEGPLKVALLKLGRAVRRRD